MMQQSIPRRTAILLVAGALSTLAARNATAQTPELELPKAKSVVALVDKAVALVESKGKAAFADFRQKGSEWFSGDTYIFFAGLERQRTLQCGGSSERRQEPHRFEGQERQGVPQGVHCRRAKGGRRLGRLHVAKAGDG